MNAAYTVAGGRKGWSRRGKIRLKVRMIEQRREEKGNGKILVTINEPIN
jgi:hypothetical protein